MKRGFTLVEFLVVVAILFMMAAIMMPPRCGSRENSRRNACQSNLKQLSLALIQYTQDNDERLPRPVTRPPWPRKLSVGWAELLQPYVKSKTIWNCPSVEARAPRWESPWLLGYTDYFLNARVGGRSLAYFDEPARTIAMAEGNDGRDRNNAAYSYSGVPAKWLADERSPARRHLDTANYAFVDGHVKATRPNWMRDYSFDPRPSRGR